MEFLKHILFGNFWSFLLILSGIVDIAIGVFVLTGVLPVKNHQFLIFIICLIIGMVYLAGGFTIALVKMRKTKD